MFKRLTITGLIIATCLAVPLLVEWKTTKAPSTKDIHIEFFRYGSNPSIIRANRGDEINLTFSTQDTGHSFLIQDYRIEAKVSPASETVELRDPLDVDVPFEDVKEVKFMAGLKGWWGHLVNVSRFRCHIYCGRMHGFEQGDLIVRPNVLFSGSIGLLVGLVIVSLMRALREDAYVRPISTSLDLNKRFRFLDKILKWRPFQFLCTLPVMAGFTLIVIAGFFGTKVGGRNIGVMLTWSVWMALLTMILVPFLGRSWCMLCPLPSLGEYLQRGATVKVRKSDGKGRYGNKFFGLGLRWPRKLRGPWIRMLIFLCMGTLSASMAGQPRWTAMALFSLCVLAIIMSLVWELRAFCRYVCPVSTFISLYSPLGRVEVRSRDKDVCSNCKERTCLRGNEKGWACPYGLCVPNIDSNIDCGLCLECFKSCSYDNVALNIRKGAWYDTFKNYGQAWRAIVMMCLGMVYPLTILSPWAEMRDMVNVVDKVTWAQFGHYAVVLWIAALFVVPLTFWLMTRLGMKLSGSITEQTQGIFSSSTGDYFKKTMPALIPVGLSFWATFFVATVMVNFSYILLAISDPFGHGWDLLGIAGLPWVQIYPAAIPWLQAALIFTGLIFSFKKGFRFWFDITEDKKNALKGFAPLQPLLLSWQQSCWSISLTFKQRMEFRIMRIQKSTVFSIAALLVIFIGIPLAIFSYEAKRSGQTLKEYFNRTLSKIRHKEGHPSEETLTDTQLGKRIDFLKRVEIGDPVGDTKPWITHLDIVDLDGDGLKDVVLCDAKLNEIRWIRQFPAGTYSEKKIGGTVRAPAHVTPSDIDKDGDLDLLIAKMGIIFPENDKIGAVVVLENNGKQEFTNHVLVDNIARVCDVEPGDFDGDGDIDLAVAQFGYDDGEIRWMENKGNWEFESHILQSLSGPIHALVSDIDKDGDLDITGLVSQEWEEIYIFENDGQANFKTNLIYGSANEDFGSSGISLIDLDKDGDEDILYTNGDAFDYIPPQPRPWHGVQWLENKGSLKFDYHRIGDFPGAYFANGVDVDQDNDLDVFVVSNFNTWEDPDAQSFAWFENDGQMNFVYRDIASDPTHLLVLDSADMDGDGWTDFVSGGMHAYPPYDRMSRVILWLNNWPDRKE